MSPTNQQAENDWQAANPLTELRAYLHEVAERCRSQGWFGALFRVGVAEDIAADVATAQQTAAEKAKAAHVHVMSAAGLLEAARHPESDGGEHITEREFKRIQSLLNRGATAAHEAASALTV